MQEGTDAVPVKILLSTVFQSIIEVVILCAAGYILARAGILDKPTQRKLNVVNVSLMTPALLFSKVAFSLTPAKLKEMWIIPLGFVIVTLVSAMVAWGLGTIFRLKNSQRSFAMCAAMFQNSNSLPIALIQSLVVEVPGLRWGNQDTKDQMLGRALAYLVVYSTLGMMLRWSYGVRLLSKADEDAPEVTTEQVTETILTEEPATLDQPGNGVPHPGARETDPFFSSNDRIKADEREEDEASGVWRTGGGTPNPADSSDPYSAHTLRTRADESSITVRSRSGSANRKGSRQTSFPRRPSQMSRAESGREFWGLPEAGKSRTDLRRQTGLSDHEEEGSDSSDEEEHSDEEWGDRRLPFTRRRQTMAPPHTRMGAFLLKLKNRSKNVLRTLNEFLTVPMYSALLSIFIACIPPLQALLNDAKPLTQAIKSAGQCSIPLTLVVLGAFFYQPPAPAPTGSQIPPSSPVKGGFLKRKLAALKSPKEATNSHPGENKTVFVAVFSRMILVPLILLPAVALIARYDYFEAAEDPVFILAAVLIISSPPALTLAQITQAASGDAFERLISKTITWSYAVLTPPLTLAYVVLGLVFGRL